MSNKNKQKEYSDDAIELMCKLLKEGKKSCHEISVETGIDKKHI